MKENTFINTEPATGYMFLLDSVVTDQPAHLCRFTVQQFMTLIMFYSFMIQTNSFERHEFNLLLFLVNENL